MNKKLLLILLSASLMISCGSKEWSGRYKNATCSTLEYVELHGDKTMDIKYYSASVSINKNMIVEGSKFISDSYIFELKDGKLVEISGLEPNCELVKDTTYGFWDKLMQP